MRLAAPSACALVFSACALVALTTLTAVPARAQVAVAVTIAEEDASQRDIASQVVSLVRKKWRVLRPQLTSSQTKGCPAGNTECLRKLAAMAKATHLLVVGVAPLGVRDRVVAVQLFSVHEATPLFEESVVQSGFHEDYADVKRLAANLVGVDGPPPYEEEPPPPFVSAEPPANEIGAWSVGGFALVGGGAVTAITSGLSGWALLENQQPQVASQVLLVGMATGGVLAAVGTMAFVVDAL